MDETPEHIARDLFAKVAMLDHQPSAVAVIAEALTAYGAYRFAAGHRAGQEAMRQAVLMRLPGGTHCDPQEWADDIRALPLEDTSP